MLNDRLEGMLVKNIGENFWMGRDEGQSRLKGHEENDVEWKA